MSKEKMKNPNYDILPDWCYGVLVPTNEIIIIKKGENCYYETDYDPAKSYEAAEKWCDRINEQVHIEKNVRKAMEWGSMHGWDTPGADPLNPYNLIYLNKEGEKQL